MTNSNPKNLLQLYKYNNLKLSDPELDKLQKHPDEEESEENIPFEEVMPEDSPPRPEEKAPLKKKNRYAEDKSDNNTPPAQL